MKDKLIDWLFLLLILLFLAFSKLSPDREVNTPSSKESVGK
ncbi:hypothetical protein ES704_02782 [subsurface metagenome]|jgi:biopolymer transport protein ExbD